MMRNTETPKLRMAFLSLNLSTFALFLLAIFVFLSFASGTGISLYLNAQFGASRIGELGLYIALVCDLFKIGLSAAFLYLTGWIARFFALMGIFAFAILSILSSYGYAIQHIEYRSGAHKAEQLRYQQLRTQKAALLQQRKQLGQHRHIAAIEVEVRSLKQSHIYWDKRRSDQCRNATIPASISLCNRLNRLEVERLEADTAFPKIQRVQLALKETNKALSAINLSQITQHSDPFARSFGTVEQVNVFFNLFLACLIEIATTAGLPLFIVLLRVADRKWNKAAKKKRVSLPAGYRRRMSDLDGFSAFAKSCLIKAPDGYVTSEDLLHAYQICLQSNPVLRPLNARLLGMKMTELGYERVRRQTGASRRQTVYTGIRLKV